MKRNLTVDALNPERDDDLRRKRQSALTMVEVLKNKEFEGSIVLNDYELGFIDGLDAVLSKGRMLSLKQFESLEDLYDIKLREVF